MYKETDIKALKRIELFKEKHFEVGDKVFLRSGKTGEVVKVHNVSVDFVYMKPQISAWGYRYEVKIEGKSETETREAYELIKDNRKA